MLQIKNEKHFFLENCFKIDFLFKVQIEHF